MERELTRAGRVHAKGMIATLAAAFIDEPALSWVWPDREDRAARLKIFFKPIVTGTLANGLALRSANDEALLLWRVPGKIHPGFFETLVSLPAFMNALGPGRERAQALAKSLRAHEPEEPYWYLQFVGVAPAYQGKGWGGAAVCAGLEMTRAAGMPAYLETSKPANFEFYKHLGFQPREEWRVPDGGPPVWSLMWRG